jgi:RNA polymerase sigma factor (sigma-70 family)
MDDWDSPPNAETNGWGMFGVDDDQGIVELFESMRDKMVIFFEVRHCIDPEELADETLERVLQKLCQGTEVSDLIRYSYGVAKNIFHEHLRRERAKQKYVEAEKHRSGPDPSDDTDDAALREQRLQYLEDCLARLSEQGRSLLSEYYKFTGQLKLDHRKKMAEELNISREALTLRVFHLKRKLKKCINDCLENN